MGSSHIFVEKGKTTAFGGHPLELVVGFPYLDIIFLKGGLLPLLECLLPCTVKKHVKMMHMCLQG